MAVAFGDTLQQFYVALSEANPDIHYIIELVGDLEHHVPQQQLGEQAEVLSEITKDCVKKSVQCIRAPIIETVNKLKVNATIKLGSKAALNAEAAALHSQRHLHVLMEIVGTWSNIVSSIVIESNYDISREFAGAILSGPYSAVVKGACIMCFTAFKKDKDLDSWIDRVMHAAQDDVNLTALDGLVTQAASMREIMSQHYAFLHATLSGLRSNSHEDNSAASDGAGGALTPTKSIFSSGGGSGSVAAAYTRGMLIVGSEELAEWRELEALYTLLERAYLARALVEAFSDTCLLEVESGAYIPQAVEDAFFLMTRSCERAASTGDEACIVGVSSQIVELLSENEAGDSDNHALLFTTVTSRDTFRRCAENECVSSRTIDRALAAMKRQQLQRQQKHLSSSSCSSSSSKMTGNTSSGGHSDPMKTPAKAPASTGSRVSDGGSSTDSLSSAQQSGRIATKPSSSGGGGGSGGVVGGLLASGASTAALSQLLADGQTSLAENGIKGLISDAAAVGMTHATSWLRNIASPYIARDDGNRDDYESNSGGSSSSKANGSTFKPADGIACSDSNHNHSGNGVSRVSPPTSGTTASASATSSSSRPPLVGSAHHHSSGGGSAISNSGSQNGSSVYSTPLSKGSTHSSNSSSRQPMAKLLTPPSSTGGSGRSAAATPTLDELMLSAFDTGDDDYGGYGSSRSQAYSAAPSSGGGSGSEAAPLCEDDLLIQLNTLSMVVGSVQALHRAYTDIMATLDARNRAIATCGNAPASSTSPPPSSPSSSSSSSSSLMFVLQQLSHVERTYRAHLSREINAYSDLLFRRHLQADINQFCARSFSLSGQEMEDRYNEHNLMHAIRACVGPVEVTLAVAAGTGGGGDGVDAGPDGTGGATFSGSGSGGRSGKASVAVYRVPSFLRHCCTSLSVKAFSHVLCALSTSLSAQLMDEVVLAKPFTEWGAMLLYQEVTSMTQYMESLVDSTADCRALKACHEALLLALKLLALEQPKDVTRYAIPARLMSDAQVRRILRHRCDFSKSDQDAIAAVKINIVE